MDYIAENHVNKLCVRYYDEWGYSVISNNIANCTIYTFLCGKVTFEVCGDVFKKHNTFGEILEVGKANNERQKYCWGLRGYVAFHAC